MPFSPWLQHISFPAASFEQSVDQSVEQSVPRLNVETIEKLVDGFVALLSEHKLAAVIGETILMYVRCESTVVGDV